MADNLNDLATIINKFMESAQQSLLHVITSLQSDQLLQQMRNDQNLYKQKMKYINQLIKEHFVVPGINDLLIKQIQSLKEGQQQLQNRLQQSKQQYISQLSNIQVQYNQFLSQKETEKRMMENTIEEKSHEIFMLKKDLSMKVKDLEANNENLQRQLDLSKKAIGETRNELQESVRQNEKLKKQITTLRQLQHQQIQQSKSKTSHLASQYTLLQQENSQLKHKLTELQQTIKESAQHQHSLLQTIERMKEDMFLIKQQWQKRCDQVEKQLAEEYRNKLIAQEQEMNQKLKLYVDELKMGKNVIIQSSQEILQSKKQLIQQRFNSEIKRYQQDFRLLEHELHQQKDKAKQLLLQLNKTTQKLYSKQAQLSQIKVTISQIKVKLQTQTKNYQSLIKSKHQQLQHKLSTTKHQTDKQIDRLRKTQSMLLKDLKTSKCQKQQILKQVHSLKQQFSSYKDKQIKQAKRLKQLQNINQSTNMKILQLKKDLAIMGEKSSMDQRTLKDRNNQINRLENNITQIKNQYKELDALTRRLQLKISQLNLKVKEHQRIKAETTHKVQKLYLAIRKLSKQLTLVKQDIIFHINLQKPQLQSILLSITQQIATRQQTLKLSHKQKIRELLDELDSQRKQQNLQKDQLINENENMKKQIRLLQQVMREKDEDYLYTKERAINIQVDKCRALMQEEITKERDQRRKLEESMYRQEKRFQYNIAKAEKEVGKQVAGFLAKWEGNLAHTQELLLAKEKALKDLTNQFKKLSAQYQSIHQQLQQTQQKITKQQRKYDSLKQQRDKTIDQMMKRLQKQTRHKLALQKQLKDIRGEIIKTQPHTTNSSSPFNNYSFTDRENANVYTNAFQTTTQDKIKTHVKHTNREKELSQIREMIAKTYKVVDHGAEKDQPIHKGKLF